MSRIDHWRLPDVAAISDLGDLEASLSSPGGQSKGIFPITNHPGWLFKQYLRPGTAAEAAQLDALIALPTTVSEPDRGLLSRATSWPVCRVNDASGKAMGCVLPRAPDRFKAKIQLTPSKVDEKYLDIDWLAQPEQSLARRGLAVPSAADRIRACRGLVEIGAFFERQNLVYSDWSYSNVLWDPEDRGVFLIDVDGCRSRSAPNVHQPNWDDPLTPRAGEADARTDRYRIALLVGRCITGEREVARVLHSIAKFHNESLSRILLDILLVTDRTRRPSMSALLAVIDGLPYIRTPGLPCRNLPPVPPARTIPDPLNRVPKIIGTPRRPAPVVTRKQPATTSSSGEGSGAAITILVLIGILLLVLFLAAIYRS